MLARRLTSFARDQRGSALVEGAVVFPLLLLVLFGVYEFSWFFYQQHMVAMGLRDVQARSRCHSVSLSRQ